MTAKRVFFILAALLTIFALSQTGCRESDATGDSQTGRVLIVTGIDYPGHKWKETAPALAEVLGQDERLKVEVVTEPAYLASPELNTYDTVVLHFMNWESPDPGPEAREGLANFVREGGGLFVVHFACGAFQGWDEYEEITGPVWDPNLRAHDPRGPFMVEKTDVEHPITAGMEAFETDDELYTCLAGDVPITTLAHAKSKVDGKYYPMAFTLQYGKGRVFNSPLGHDVGAIMNPYVAELFRRGCAWTAGLPLEGEFEPKLKKIAFIAGKPSHGEGNHEWDKDALFLKQCLDSAANIEPLDIVIHNDGWPEDASALDDADAVVFLADGHEMHPLKAPERFAKIQELADKGVGLAFLHYCIEPPNQEAEDDFLQWMGGYYERGFSQNPINKTPVTIATTDHPICRGCGGYATEDEWYFDIRFKPEVQDVTILMTGKLPPYDPKDKALAWATEREDGGRGFGFSGGHYHTNWHMEPFRKPVLNAILWTAKAEVPQEGVKSVQPWRFVSIPDFLNVDLEYPQAGWEDTLDYVLKAVKAENPEFVLVAGDLVMGRWPDKDSIKEYAEKYYTAWKQRMDAHGLKYYTAIGDHEIGDNPWPEEKAELVSYFKRQFQRHLKMPLNGPYRMRGTAFWLLHENTLFVAVDVFEKGEGPQGGIVPKVTGEQLEWFNTIIAQNNGVEHIVVMGHTPVLGPVAKESSSGLMLEGGADSPFWQAMKDNGVDMYLCGEVHAITCTREDGVMQIAHGGLFGYNEKVNYLVGTVHDDRIELELKELSIVNSGEKLWQSGNNRPFEKVTIMDEAKRKGFVTVGECVLDKKGKKTAVKDASGFFEDSAK